MFDNLIDNLDFLHINSKNATRLIQAVSNVCFAFLLYDFSGGKVIFPKDISTKVIFDFVYSYQIIIPIVVYIITWGTFYWFFKPVFSNVINFISYITSNLSKSKKSSNPIDVINSKHYAKAYSTKLRTHHPNAPLQSRYNLSGAYRWRVWQRSAPHCLHRSPAHRNCIPCCYFCWKTFLQLIQVGSLMLGCIWLCPCCCCCCCVGCANGGTA